MMAIQYAYGLGEENVEITDGEFYENDYIEGDLDYQSMTPYVNQTPNQSPSSASSISISGQVKTVFNGKAKLILVNSSDQEDLPSEINLFDECHYHQITTAG